MKRVLETTPFLNKGAGKGYVFRLPFHSPFLFVMRFHTYISARAHASIAIGIILIITIKDKD